MQRTKHGQKPAPFVVAALLSLSCSRPAAPISYPGDSAGHPASEPARSPSAASAKHERWDRYDEVTGWPAAHDRPFLSQGHLWARHTASIVVDPSAREAYLNLVAGSVMPVGTIVAALHEDPRTGNRGPIFAMQKIAADRWEYFVTNAEGRLEHRGDLPLCRRCHAEAVADQLFGLPRSSDRNSIGRP